MLLRSLLFELCLQQGKIIYNHWFVPTICSVELEHELPKA